MTDFSRAVNAPGITGMAYNSADGILYLGVMSGEVLRYSPTTGQFLSPVEVGGLLSGIAISPDGSFLIVGSPALTSDGHGGYNATIDRVLLSNSSIDQLTVPVANGVAYPLGGIQSLAITNNGQAFASTYTQEWQFTAAATTPTFSSISALPTLSTADQGRYLIETEIGISPPPLKIVDTQTNTIAGPVSLDNTPMAIDVSPTTGQVAALTYFGEVSLYDQNLTLEQHLNSSAISGDSLASLHYSVDGQSLFVLDASKDSVVIFNTTTWAETGSISLPAGVLEIAHRQQMTVSSDGRFLFVQTTGGIVSLDLSAHPTSVAAAPAGTAATVDTRINAYVPPVGASGNTTQVIGAYTVGAGQNQVFNETQSPPYELIHGSVGAAITFDDQGQVHLNSSVANADLAAVIDDGQLDAHALVKVSPGGVLEVDATGPGSSAIGYVSPEFSGSVENDGIWTVSGVATAAGATGLGSSFGSLTFTNTGDFEVNGSVASGVSGSLGFLNSGQFSVSGDSALGVSGAFAVTNSGALTVTATNHGAIAIQGAPTIDNSGTITADVAISAPAPVINNSGTINGALDLGFDDELVHDPNGVIGSQITNTGAINGAIHFDDGNVLYDGAGGTQTGGIYLGEGTDRVVLGNDGETVHDNAGYDIITGGAGNDTVMAGPGDANFDGGAGADTLVYGSTYSAATVTQTAGGHTVSGPDGVDTISSVEILQFADQQRVLGSAGEMLTARAGGDALYGGPGADALVSGPGNDAINGGAGTDTAVFSADLASYSIRNTHGVFTITGPDGTDTVRDVETFQFNDQTAAASSFAPISPSDFKGDGYGDILWRNDNGDVYLWNSQNGGAGFDFQDLGNPGTAWGIQAVGDYTGDGKADILWRNTNGDVFLWNSQSGSSVAFTYQDLGVIGANWHVQPSAGDFNGDGKADVLWRNDNGDVYLWSSQPGAGVAFQNQDLGVVPSSWHILKVDDFNGDAKADVLWRNDNGDVYIWNSQPGAAVTFQGQDLGVFGPNWQINATGDVNGDGKADIIWQDNTGDTYLWDSGSGSGGADAFQSQHLGVIPTNYQIQDVSDANGDGKADVLWQDTAGNTYLWLAGGSGSNVSFSSASEGAVDTAWHVQSDWHFL